MMSAHRRVRPPISDPNDSFGNQPVFNGLRFSEGRWRLWAAAHRSTRDAHSLRRYRGAAGGLEVSGGPEWTEVEVPFLDQLVSMGGKLVPGSVDHPSSPGASGSARSNQRRFR